MCKVKVYNLMIRYTYILLNVYHNKVGPFTSHNCYFVVVLMLRTLKLYCQYTIHYS